MDVEGLWEYIVATRVGIGLFFVTLFGSVVVYVLSSLKGVDNSEAFLRRFFPNQNDTFYIRLDFFVMCFVGAIIGTIVYTPSTVYQSLAAGVGWTGAMNVLLSSKPPAVPSSRKIADPAAPVASRRRQRSAQRSEKDANRCP